MHSSANPLSAQDDIAAFLYEQGLHVYAWRSETKAQYRQCIHSVLAFRPAIVTDDCGALYAICKPVQVRPNVERFSVNGKKLFLLSKGRVVNLIAAEGNQPEVMALSFANQLLSIPHIAKNHGKMERKVHGVPEKLDELVAMHALGAMGIKIDEMTKEQRRYQASS